MYEMTDCSTASTSFEPLSPTSFLERSSEVYGTKVAIVDGDFTVTYAQFFDRTRRLAQLLRETGVQRGDLVAVLAPNNHVLLESHYGVPFCGATLVALNTRLAAAELAYIVTHAGCRVLICDPQFEEIGRDICALADVTPDLILADDDYERQLSDGPFLHESVLDERGLLALNYTSGTTGTPKGVMYHHRGAYLQSLAMTRHFDLSSTSVYLWTLPMFHCNGWCFTWAVTAVGGTHVCLPEMTAASAWRLIHEFDVTHFCAAPTVLLMLAASPDARPIEGHSLKVAVGGAPPTPSLIQISEGLGLDVTHLYGLTETFGPVAICEWKAEWNDLASIDRSRLRARQGVGNVISQNLRVVGLDMDDVPRDGTTIGEIVIRGNNVMLGYYNDSLATDRAFYGGWFHTGDLAVMHQDYYIEIRDRAKDIIVSGGENISSVEVEATIASHPAILEVAVVAGMHPHWGERPIAFVVVREGRQVGEEEIRDHVRRTLARFKVPDRIIFGPLPKTGTGKIQKFRLRKLANSLPLKVGGQHVQE
jgi:fatty-acyl-CoA synthase